MASSGRSGISECANWATDFVEQVTRFAGVAGKRDDFVDAFADAYTQVAETGSLQDYIAWIRAV